MSEYEIGADPEKGERPLPPEIQETKFQIWNFVYRYIRFSSIKYGCAKEIEGVFCISSILRKKKWKNLSVLVSVISAES